MKFTKLKSITGAIREKQILAIALTLFLLLGLTRIPEVATWIAPNMFFALQEKRADLGIEARTRKLAKAEKELQDYLDGHGDIPNVKAPWWPPDQKLPEIYTLRIMVQVSAEDIARSELLKTALKRQWREFEAGRP